MLPRIEYSVVVPVSVDLAFRAFSDLNRLLDRDIYDGVSWIEGKPWEIGSRIRYVVAKPIPATIHAVVTAYEPPQFAAVIYHAFGVTAEQQVNFSSTRKGSSVHLILEFVGAAVVLPDDVVRQSIASYARDALDSMAVLCQQWKSAASSG